MTTKTITQVQVATQKVNAEAEYAALIRGIMTDLSPSGAIELNGTSYTPSQLTQEFQVRIDTIQNTRKARQALQSAVAAERAAEKKTGVLRAAMKLHLQSRFGKANVKLQNFGFTQAKLPVIDAATKAKAVQKMVATRAARGIMGKKQRAAINAPQQPAVATVAAPAPTVSNPPAPAVPSSAVITVPPSSSIPIAASSPRADGLPIVASPLVPAGVPGGPTSTE